MSNPHFLGGEWGFEIDISGIEIVGNLKKSTLLDDFKVVHNLVNTDSLYISGAASKGFSSSGLLIQFDIIVNSNIDKFPITELRVLLNEGKPTVKVELGSITIVSNEEDLELTNEITLHQNYPNPFNPSTNITYQLPEARDVNISVFDITGRLIQILQNGKKAAGSYTLNFQASNLSSGVYFYRITAGDFVQTQRMLLIK